MISTKIFLITLLFAGALLQVPNCKTPVGTDSCSACNEGFSKTPKAADATKFECTACGAECKKCKEGTVAATPGDCEECKQAEGFGIDAADKKKCSACDETNCKVCKADNKKCETCKTDFAVKDTKCVACKSPCKECSEANVCTSCISAAFYLDTKACKACPDGCSECKNDKECTKCATSNFMNAQNLCTKDCGTGNVGNALTGKCEACTANCVSCTQVGKCDACKEGWYANSNGQCTACGTNCVSCYSNGRCKTCTNTNDYYLDDDGTCQEYRWYHKWWWWLLIGLALLALLGALAWLLSRPKTQPNYGGYQQWDNNTSYAPRAQQPSYRAEPEPQYNSSFRESATYQRPLSPARSHVVVGPPVRTSYSPGRVVVGRPPVVHHHAPGYELGRRF